MTVPYKAEQTTASRPRPAAAIEDDLAFVRQVAESGQSLPMLGGRYHVLWGVTVTVATLVNWLIVTRVLPVSFWAIPITWFGLSFLAIGIGARFTADIARHNRAATVGNRVEKAVWIVAGSFFFIFFLGIFLVPIVRHFILGTSEVISSDAFELFPPITFGVYAIAIAATGAASGHRLFQRSSLASLGFLLLTLLTMGSHHQLLVSAVGVMIVLVLPGVLMMREEAAFRAAQRETV